MNLAAVKRHPLFTLVLVASLAAVVAEGWWLHLERQKSARARLTLSQRQQERDWLASRSPALSEENSAALAADVAAAEKGLAAVRNALAGRERSRAEAPARPIDAYFEIASGVEKLRALAGRQQVLIAPDEQFGFATHANEGPEAELIGRVHLQRLVIEHLVTALLEARPRALLGVQRERPVPVALRAARRAPGAEGGDGAAEPRTGGVPADFFTPDPQLRLRHAGLVDAEAFRVEFTGQTQVLRAFLNEIGGFRLPLVVRSVQVEPILLEGPGSADSEPDPRQLTPIVIQNISKFAVIVEYVDVILQSGPLRNHERGSPAEI